MSRDTGGTGSQTLQQEIVEAEVQTDLRAEMAELRTLVKAQQAELEELRSHVRTAKNSKSVQRRSVSQTAGRASSRRALLKWGGAAAAAATVAMAAGNQAAHANPLNDGNSLSAGNTVTAEHATTLQYDGSSGNAKILFLANDTPFHASDASFPAALGGWVGGGTSGNNTGVYGFSSVSGGIGVVGNASGIGVYGASTNDKGVYATTTNTVGQSALSAINFGTAMGVYAETKDATNFSPAIKAVANNGGTGDGVDAFGANDSSGVLAAVGGTAGNGVLASATGILGYGVWGKGDTGYGVVGETSTGIDVHVGGITGPGRLAQNLQGTVGAPTAGSHVSGEQVRDAFGELWLCIANGTPGTWVRAAHVPNGYSGGGIAYLSKPIRLLDTRGSDPNALHNGGGPYTVPGGPYSLVIAGVNWMSVLVPSTAVGAIGKVTVISGVSGSGFVALVPHGSGTPTTGTLPYGASQIVATSFNVGLDGVPGALDIYIGGTPVDVVIDLFAVVA